MKYLVQFGYRFSLVLAIVLAGAFAATAQTTSTGTLNVELVNGSGLVMVFNTDASGVTLGNAGTASATLAFGNVSEYGSLGTSISRTVGTSSFTVSTPFDVNVEESGTSSANYNLSASLSAAPPSGITLEIGSVTLSTTSQIVSTSNSYGSNIPHTLSAVISTSASGATQVTSTINFTATAN